MVTDREENVEVSRQKSIFGTSNVFTVHVLKLVYEINKSYQKAFNYFI